MNRKPSRLIPSLGIGFFIFWLINVVLGLALTVAAIYVAFHFIMKYW